MVVSGSAAIQRQQPEWGWDRQRGRVEYHVWEGVKAAIEAQELVCINSEDPIYGSTQVTTKDNVLFRLSAAVSPDDVTENWEIEGCAIQEDIFTHPRVVNELFPNEVSRIKAAMLEPKSWESTAPVTDPTALKLWELAKREQLNYQRSYYVLRYTLSGSRAVEFDIYDPSQVDHIFAYDQLPLDNISGFPAVRSMIKKINDAGPPWTLPADYSWGWLMQSPKLAQAWNGKITITQEWWLYGWSNFIYPDATI